MYQGVFYGTVLEVYPPNHKFNKSKGNTEYLVSIIHDGYSAVPVHCVYVDPYGSPHNFLDSVLGVGNRVIVMFPRGEGTVGVIFGGYRSTSKKPVKETDGYFYRHRFNEVETFISNLGSWQVKSDDGPSETITKKQIILDDSVGEKITLDKEKKSITLEAETWTVIIKGNANISVEKNLTATVKETATITANNTVIKTKTMTADVAENADINVKNDLKVKARVAQVTCTGKATIKAPKIELNDAKSGVTTMNSHQGVVDFITGIPVTPSTTVFGDI